MSTLLDTTWVDLGPVHTYTPDRGRAALVEGRQIAVFVLADGTVRAIDNRDPISGANVLSRGIVGDRDGVPVVASPIYKQCFDLETGRCLDQPDEAIAAHAARVVDGRVLVRVDPHDPTRLVTVTELPLPTRRPPKPALDHKPELLALDAGEHYRFAFAMESCVGCHSCEAASAEQNGLPADTVWRRVGEIEGGTFPDTKRFHLSMSCNHCLEPACLEGCPTNAYIKLDNGIVQHQADECIGCQYCTWNCPYSVPTFQPDRRIVTKCDMCLPRLEDGRLPACVDACPTHAITVEKVNVEAWRADHSEADAPNLPSSDLTLSTTRISLPADVPIETYSGSAWSLRPEHPHWPLVWLTLLTQVAVGASATASGPAERALAAVAALVALGASLLHLGRPVHAWKALRNLRRSWLSREVALFGAYGGLAALAVVVPVAAAPAAVIGAAGVFASGRLYVVPGRPAWHSPLTIVRFFATALAVGPLLTGNPGWALVGLALQVVATVANLVRLGVDPRIEWWGSLRLTLDRFRLHSIAVLLGWAGGAALAAIDRPLLALPLVAAAELVGRYLFYVTVVPLDMPGSFSRTPKRHP